MRILQAHISKSISDFPFLEIYRLDDYNEQKEPSIFFGMYRYEDFCLAEANAEPIIFWTGQDALDKRHWPKLIGKNYTAHKRVYDRFNELGIQIEKVKPSTFLNSVNPQRVGPKIYAYCPRQAEDYHGKKVIDELRLKGYNILIGDGSFQQNQWRKEMADDYYSDIFIGLCLSEFAGGGTSIIEMGLRGIRVVTNVFDLPHCIPWETATDVANIIEKEKTLIGTTNKKLAQDVWESLDHDHTWLEI